MTTVIAHSVRGAVKLYLYKNRPPHGSSLSAKPRGHGEWEHFKVTR